LKSEKHVRRAAKTESAGVPLLQRPAFRHILAGLALVVAALFAYSNSFHAPFLLDNEEIILKDPRIHAASPVQLHRILTQQYWETAPTGLYRPLTTLSYLFNYAILGGGADPTSYHWINFALHALNMILVYWLCLAVFEQTGLALLTSALWGLHPVLTESVTNIVGRADLLAAASVLGALLCHRTALRTRGFRRAACVASIMLMTAVGMFAKESAIVTLALLPIYDLTIAKSEQWRKRIPNYLAAAVPCAVYLYVRAQVLAGSPYLSTHFGDNPLLQTHFWAARMTAFHVIGRYLLLLLWPARLSYDYSYNEIPIFGQSATADAGAILGLIACVAAVGAAIVWRKRYAPAAFFVAFFFTTLAPVSNLVIVIGSIMAERFLYLPAVGFAGCAVYLGWFWSKQIAASSPGVRTAVRVAVAVALLALIGRTYARNNDWNDPHRFWMSAADAAPNSYKANLNAATSTGLLTQEDWDQSIYHAGRALEILRGLPDEKNEPFAYRAVGMFYRSVGEHLASQKSQGPPSSPASPEYWFRKSLDALLQSERMERRYDQQYRDENAARGKPGLTSLPSQVYLELGRTYMHLGDAHHAIEAYERGRYLESNPDLLEELSAAYRSAGDLPKAALAAVESMAVDPARTRLASTLVELYAKIDPAGCAVVDEGGTRTLNVECPLVHRDICAASRNAAGTYARRGQQFEAESIRQIAVRDLGCTPESLQ
jgi:tetratricopeptide (TPR) repeat protein